MATVPQRERTREVDYPTSDGRPMAETQLHLNDMVDVLQMLDDFFAEEPRVHVAGNLLLYYEEGNPRKHLAPDIFVTFGIEKLPLRDYFLVWKERKAPDVVFEITSKTTKREDQKKKLVIYREILKVPEYFLFDPREDYLNPPLQGFRLVEGKYAPIEPVAGRIPSDILGLHLERDGPSLRLFDPARGVQLLTPREARDVAERKAAAELERAEEGRQRAATAEASRQRLSEENDRLRREIESLRGR